MNKYIDAERLIAEIEKIAKKYIDPEWQTVAGNTAKSIRGELRAIITSLQQEQPEVDLEKEIDAFFYGKNFKRCNDGVRVPGALMRDWQNQKVSRSLSTDEIRRFARHFAEWGAEHLKK